MSYVGGEEAGRALSPPLVLVLSLLPILLQPSMLLRLGLSWAHTVAINWVQACLSWATWNHLYPSCFRADKRLVRLGWSDSPFCSSCNTY